MKQGDDDVVDNYRGTQDYAEDVNAMVRYMRSQSVRKVWTIGTSRGTLSVANYVARYSKPRERTGPDGQIYTSGFWKLSDEGFTIWSLANHDARKLKLPTLLVVHKQDVCPDTNPTDLLEPFKMWLSGGGAAVSVHDVHRRKAAEVRALRCAVPARFLWSRSGGREADCGLDWSAQADYLLALRDPSKFV